MHVRMFSELENKNWCLDSVFLSCDTTSRNPSRSTGSQTGFQSRSLQVASHHFSQGEKMTGCTAHLVTLSQVESVQTVVLSRPFAHAQQGLGRHEVSAKP